MQTELMEKCEEQRERPVISWQETGYMFLVLLKSIRSHTKLGR